jgi:uncharacterized protein (DUF2141 family)
MISKILGAVILSYPVMSAATAADLTVNVSGAKSNAGFIVGAVFDSEKNFLNRPAALASFRIRASTGEVGFAFKNLPAGKYAVTAFHDTNDNGKLDAGTDGQPIEMYGFSNGARGASGPPAFGEAAFEVGSQAKTVSIELAY